MRRQKIGRRRIDGVVLLRLDLGIALQRGEEAHRAVRIVTGARGDADADRVRFEFLLLREARQLKLRFGERQRARFRIVDHVGDDAADQIGLLLLLLAQLGMVGDDMAHLMGDHRGELGIVVGERDQSARHIKLAGRQRKGIDRLRIEDGDLVMQVGPLRRRDQALDHLLDHGLQPRIVVDAAVGRQDALMLTQHRRRHGGIGLLGRRRAWPARGTLRAASRCRRRAAAPRARRPPGKADSSPMPDRPALTMSPVDRADQSRSAVSICSGCTASIAGLPRRPRASTQPRTIRDGRQAPSDRALPRRNYAHFASGP